MGQDYYGCTIVITLINKKGEIMERKFDKEYRTQWGKEVEHLTNKGFRWTFVKTEDEILTYKYKRSSALFLALAEFYMNIGQ